MRTYILCPYYKTGGPRNMHNLCNYLNQLKPNSAFLYYIPSNQPIPLYTDLPNLHITTSIQDHPQNLLIIPEIYSLSQVRHTLPNITIAIWWLSYTNAALFNTLKENTENPASIHFFHSYFEYANIRPLLPPKTMWFYLSDYIDIPTPEPSTNPFDNPDLKEDLVAYNHAKDKITPYYCSLLNIPTLPIKDMSPYQVSQALQRVKVYIDLGYHPGKDRLPREAALHNAVIITNKAGAAAYQEVVPIQEKITHEDDLLLLLPEVLANYPLFLKNQDPYRTKIKNEKEIFQRQVQQTWDTLNGLLSPSLANQSPVVV